MRNGYEGKHVRGRQAIVRKCKQRGEGREDGRAHLDAGPGILQGESDVSTSLMSHDITERY